MVKDALLKRISERGERAFTRASVHAGQGFEDVIASIEHSIGRRIRLKRVRDTSGWGSLTSYLVLLNSAHIYVRAEDPRIYQEYAAFHSLGHLLDEFSACTGHSKGWPSARRSQTETGGEHSAELIAELVAEDVARRLASIAHFAPPVAELAW